MTKTVRNYLITTWASGIFTVEVEWQIKRPWRFARYERTVISPMEGCKSLKEAENLIKDHIMEMNNGDYPLSKSTRGPDGSAHYGL